LAKKLQEQFVKTVNPGSRRQAKENSGVYLMEHIQRPGILVECGFLSNAAEESRLRDQEYQKKLGAVIATSVSQYLSNT
jgi:N-acetylmuramoyl-L-alanine amidase